MRWCKGKILRFIEHVRNQSILWDPNNAQRYNKLLKNAAWESIAIKMENTDILTCKRKWESIQASFRRQLSNIKRKSVGNGPDKQYRTRWYPFKSLQFLLDRKTTNHTQSCTITSNMESAEMQIVNEPYREQEVILNNNVPSSTVQADANNNQLQMETDIIIDCWTVKYRKLARDQRFYADKIAIDVLYEGELGRLSQDCAIFKSVTSKSPIIEHQHSAQTCNNICYLNLPQSSSSFNSREVPSNFGSFANTNQLDIEESAIDIKSWAVKYSRLTRDQRLLAEKIINDVLFQGAFGTLTPESTILPVASASNESTPISTNGSYSLLTDQSQYPQHNGSDLQQMTPASNESTRAPISTNGSYSFQADVSQYPQHNGSLHQITPVTGVNLTSNSPEVVDSFPRLVDISEISPTFLDYFQD